MAVKSSSYVAFIRSHSEPSLLSFLQLKFSLTCVSLCTCMILSHSGMKSNGIQRTETDKRCEDVYVGTSPTFFLFSLSGNGTKRDEVKLY